MMLAIVREVAIVREETLKNLKVFRAEDGQPSSPKSLRLTLRDFGTEELMQQLPDLDQELRISSEQLYNYLLEAERRQEAYVWRVGSVNNIKSGALKLQRTETPPDEAGSQEESDSDVAGQRKKRGRIDSDYSPSSPSTSSDH